MSDDSFTEVTSQGWGSRILQSIKGVLVGGAFFVGSFPLLVWNEGRAVKTARSLEEGAGAVVSVPAQSVDRANEGKLVHVSGEATTSETLADPDFGVSAPAIRLQRVVEMYQWDEDEKSETRNKLGGGTETVKTYTYKKVWSDDVIDSGRFKKPEGHENPASMPFESRQWTAQAVTVGGYRLSESQVGRLDKAETVAIDGAARLPEAVAARVKAAPGQNMFYVGKDPAAAAVGDARITFKAVRPAAVSLVARQVGETFEAYHARAGGTVDLLEYGLKSADSMFQAAQAANTTLTWILRGGGFLIMFLGLVMVFKPISVFGDVIPIVGTLLGAGLALFAGAVAASLSLVTIAVSWLFFRPLVGVGLLLLAGGAVAGLAYLAGQKKKQQPA
ncbi:MAG TPA: TMEM43 family protein [Vicinamibacteria bacterium]|nr:TMEM43 family protein [Vicinamibacteria bacterium]